MQVLVLAGGHATRLWPLTKHRPKPLLPLGRATIIDRLLDALDGLPAARTVISTNAKFAPAFEAWRTRTGRRVELEVEAQRTENEKPGALAAIAAFVRAMPRPEDLFVLGGDNVVGWDLKGFAGAAKDRDGPTVACVDVGSVTAARMFGIVEPAAGGRVKAFHEKPQDPPSTLAATATYYYPAATLGLFAEYAALHPDRRSMDAPGRILEWAAPRRPVYHAPYTTPWFDVGSLQGYLDAQAFAAGRFVDGAGADSKLGPRVFVYGGATVSASDVDDVIVFPGARVTRCTLRRVAVDEGADIADVTLQDTIVEAGARMRAGDPRSGRPNGKP